MGSSEAIWSKAFFNYLKEQRCHIFSGKPVLVFDHPNCKESFPCIW